MLTPSSNGSQSFSLLALNAISQGEISASNSKNQHFSEWVKLPSLKPKAETSFLLKEENSDFVFTALNKIKNDVASIAESTSRRIEDISRSASQSSDVENFTQQMLLLKAEAIQNVNKRIEDAYRDLENFGSANTQTQPEVLEALTALSCLASQAQIKIEHSFDDAKSLLNSTLNIIDLSGNAISGAAETAGSAIESAATQAATAIKDVGEGFAREISKIFSW